MNRHEHFMHLALELAKKGKGKVSPNPMVGCVIVKEDTIIGQGYHMVYGGPHAEPNAVNSVQDKNDIAESDVYVTLEPCSHFGKTPPCVELLLKYHPKRVIIANLDSNPLVAGEGIRKLQNAGIEVIVGVLDQEARDLNRRFFTFMEKKRPYIILKWAQSQDGFIDGHTEIPTAISGKESLIHSHQLRADEDAILVGTNTALKDNPSLTTRLVEGKNPFGLYSDKQLNLPQTHHLLDQSTPTICFNLLKSKTQENLEFIQLSGQSFNEQILDELYKRKISSIIVEGGAQLLQSFIDQNLWDEAIVYQSPLMLNQGLKAPKANFRNCVKEILGNDTLIRFKR